MESAFEWRGIGMSQTGVRGNRLETIDVRLRLRVYRREARSHEAAESGMQRAVDIYEAVAEALGQDPHVGGTVTQARVDRLVLTPDVNQQAGWVFAPSIDVQATSYT